MLNLGENECNNIPTLEGEKCVYQSEETNKCVIKKVCASTLDVSVCNEAITLTPEETKCHYNEEKTTCEEIDSCSVASSSSKAVCEAFKVLEPKKNVFLILQPINV